MLLSTALLVGCKSDCRKLCDTQHECSSAAPETPGGEQLIPEKRIELCRTMCEAMRSDPDRAEAMNKTTQCAGKPCGELAACIKAATSK